MAWASGLNASSSSVIRIVSKGRCYAAHIRTTGKRQLSSFVDRQGSSTHARDPPSQH